MIERFQEAKERYYARHPKVGEAVNRANRITSSWPVKVIQIVLAAAALFARRVVEAIDWDRVWDLFSSVWAQILGVVVAIVVAVALFKVRNRWPKIYAGLEFFLGVTIALLAVSEATASNAERGAKAATAIYLMIRSMDNWRREPVSNNEPEETVAAA